jgi:hypothetical protein
LCKTLFVAKGLHSTWDCFGDISVAIGYLQGVKKEVGKALGTAYQGTTHQVPDTSHLVWQIARKVQEIGLQRMDSK